MTSGVKELVKMGMLPDANVARSSASSVTVGKAKGAQTCGAFSKTRVRH